MSSAEEPSAGDPAIPTLPLRAARRGRYDVGSALLLVALPSAIPCTRSSIG